MQHATRRDDVGREALMILYITRGQMFGMHPLEFGKQHSGLLADNIYQHVQAAPVRHADHGFLHAQATGALKQMIEQRNQRLAAFQREAFLSHVFGVQVTLQRLGGSQSFKDAEAHRSIVSACTAHPFQPYLQPALLRHIADVHVFRTDAATISLAQQLQDFAQSHARS